ncbi:hypothetical protein SD70_22425 [Gordoniibacillus kamchatkensis]|uniref:Copper amine oxidase-like N-terminal domain-containing protein n=1 Tax=Gordoniibacillus kamchatkensis TaxID=1590651 RepID=A0ABR5ADN2_9BACL|nr:copper amine oxidase N-terminal domain-containing protein [Paenibacillus sp. VKM B-2647]KIL39081.1 hypothetical protein SD70_22425 [Paenibacillus sp. VKM B-2647]
MSPLIDKYWDGKRSGAVGYISGLPSMEQMIEWKDTDNTLSMLRDMAEAKGAKVTWNDNDRSVTVTKGSNTLTAKLGSVTATVNGKEVNLPTAVKLENEKTVFPTATLMNFLSK